MDAILIERNGGATTSFDYRVYLASPKGTATSGVLVADLYGAGRSASAYGVTLRWASADSLLIEYFDAKDTSQVLHEAAIGDRRVHVALRPGVVDSAAPEGGMLYNLEKSRR